MHPIFQVTQNGADITSNFGDRVIKITVVDKAGNEADTMTIELDDRDFAIANPATGATLGISMGYLETGLQPLGTFTIDEVTFEGPPYKCIVSGKAADVSKGSIKQHRTEQYANQTLGQIAQTIAGRNNLTASVSASLASVNYTYLQQTEESDLHFLTRLAKVHDALFKVGNGKLLLTARGESISASGQTIPAVKITLTDIKSYKVTTKDRAKHKSAKARWHNKQTGQRETEEAVNSNADDGDADFIVRHLFTDKDKAKAAAEAKLHELNRNKAGVTVEIGGNPSITASGDMTISDVRDGVDGTYTISEVTHEYEASSGYVTTVESEAKPDSTSDSTSTGAGSDTNGS